MAFGPKEITGYKFLFRETGYYLIRLEQYEKSLPSFSTAVSKTPTNERALLGRAVAKGKDLCYEAALKEVKKALEVDPYSLLALAHKCKNRFLNSEFEQGMVENARAKLRRVKPDDFVLGFLDCRNAIQNCLGPEAGHPLRDHFLVIRKLAWKLNAQSMRPQIVKSLKKKKKAKSTTIKAVEPREIKDDRKPKNKDERITDWIYTPVASEIDIIPPPIKYPFKPLQQYCSNIKNYMAEKYLLALAGEKKLLELMRKVPEIPGLRSPNRKGNRKILELAVKGAKKLLLVQELLRARKPMYYLKYQSLITSPGYLHHLKLEFLKRQAEAKNVALRILFCLQVHLDNRDILSLVSTGEVFRTYCETTPIQILVDRPLFLLRFYNIFCQGFYNMIRFNPNHSDAQNKQRILWLLGKKVGRPPSNDSITPQLEKQYKDWKVLIELYLQRLVVATTYEEIAWICHELTRFYIEDHTYELAQLYARKIKIAGEIMDDLRWILNYYMQLIKIFIIMDNFNSAEENTKEAINVARLTNDEGVIAFFEKMFEVVHEMEVEPESVQVLKRQQEFIELIPDIKMRGEVNHMFKTMDAMASNRRLSIIPGVKIADVKPPTAAQKSASIKPYLPAEIKPIPGRLQDIPGGVKEPPGKIFMALVQAHVT